MKSQQNRRKACLIKFQTKVKQMTQESRKMPKEFAAPSIMSSAFGNSSSLTFSTLLVYRFDNTNMAIQNAIMTYMPVRCSKPAPTPILIPIN